MRRIRIMIIDLVYWCYVCSLKLRLRGTFLCLITRWTVTRPYRRTSCLCRYRQKYQRPSRLRVPDSLSLSSLVQIVERLSKCPLSTRSVLTLISNINQSINQLMCLLTAAIRKK